jgi:hypothetical protein
LPMCKLSTTDRTAQCTSEPTFNSENCEIKFLKAYSLIFIDY